MQRLISIAAAGLLATALVGCDDGGEEDPCEDVASPCETGGATRCAGDRIEECRENADGCLEWSPVETCGASQRCEMGDEGAACVCVDACPADGATGCRGTVVRECVADSDGCLVWQDQTDCTVTGESCDESSGAAECVSTCTPTCETEGSSRCTAVDEVETCTDAGGGCLQWQVTRDCADDGEVCHDDLAGAFCMAPCTPDCEVEGETACSAGDEVETCTDAGDGCLMWTVTEDCTDDGEVCDDSGDEAVCVPDCTPTCDTEDAVRCSPDAMAIETCTMVPDGCLQWVALACGEIEECDDSGEAPVCVCVPSCTTEDERRCTSADELETCTVVAEGCLRWDLTQDCAADGRPCDDTADPPACGPPLTGDSCAVPHVVGAFPFAFSGADFFADFTDAEVLDGTGCTTRTGSPEAVFEVALAAGQGLLVRELGAIDVVLSLQTTCGAGGECVFSEDFGETTGHRYQAEADETVYVVVESWSTTSTSRVYDIRIDLWEDEICNDGLDNDLDGRVDCDDPDCFGFDPDCLVELNCTDGEDNDLDGQTDCDDSDCDADPACGPYLGVYQRWEASAALDLEGASIVLTPDPAAPNGYAWTVTTGLTAFPVAPGSGTESEVLALGDDAFDEYVLALLPGFELYGVTHDSIFVGSNGFVSFGAGATTLNPTVANFFARPVVAGLWTDLNPASASSGDVTVDELASAVVVTFDGVVRFGQTDPNSFQIVLSDDGSIELHYLAVAPPVSTRATMVGIGNGLGIGAYPDPVDLVPPPPPSAAGDVIVTEVMYDPDFVTDTNGEWFELYNTTDGPLNLEGAVFTDLGTNSFTVVGRLDIPARGYLVFGRNADPATNGGVAVDYEYPGGSYALANDDDEIILTVGGVEIDRVAWDETAGWPNAVGASIQLSSLHYDFEDNDDAESWCLGTTPYGTSTDLGTPGTANTNCMAVLYATDFETDPGWTLAGDWAWGEASGVGPGACAGGTGCVATNLTGNYSSSAVYADNFASFGPIDASGVTALALDLDMWLRTESGWDFARVEVSTDGTAWEPAPMTTPAYNRPTGGPYVEWSGEVATAWTPASADLGAWAGSATLWVRFVLRSDDFLQYPGFYIDNVALTGM